MVVKARRRRGPRHGLFLRGRALLGTAVLRADSALPDAAAVPRGATPSPSAERGLGVPGTVRIAETGPAAQALPSALADPTPSGSPGSSGGLGEWAGAAARMMPPEDAALIVAELEAAEAAKNALAAYQARLAARLLAVRQHEAEAAGRSTLRVRSGAVSELSIARRTSRWRAARLMTLAETVHAQTPRALQGFTRGTLGEERVAMLVAETAHVDPEVRTAIDEEFAEELAELSEKQAVRRIRAAVIEADPQGALARQRRAEADRYVSTRPAPDGMLSLCALLPALTGVAVAEGLKARARRLRGAGDARTLAQIQADTLAEAVLAYLAVDDGLAGPVEPAGPAVQAQVIITDLALLAVTETPARLSGYGPVPAATVREAIAAQADDPEARLSLQRLWADPSGRELVAMESTARAFPPGLARFIRARDELCRRPQCGAPVREVDHVVPHHRGGPTTALNAQGLCQAHNLDKEEPGWRDVVDAVHLHPAAVTITTTTPSGRRLVHGPPPLPGAMPGAKPRAGGQRERGSPEGDG